MSQQHEVLVTSNKRRASDTAASVMLRELASRGVRAAFGIPGGLISPLFDALADVEVDLVMTRHEGMAAFAAMGHAVATGMPALVLTTGGPGITNALTGIAAAFVEELPLIVLAGEVPTNASGRGALQDSSGSGIDVVAMLRTVTRWSARVESASQAAGVVAQALQIATGARSGPVFLSVPLDVGNQRIPAISLAPALEEVVPARPDPVACQRIATHLLRARRPLLVVGNGARAAASELRELAERVRSPIVTTPHAKGIFPDSHPLHLGGIGLGGHPSVDAYLARQPDVVCVIGSRLGDLATNAWTIPLVGSEATYQIDREPRVFGRSYPLTLGVVGDARLAVRSMIAKLPTDSAPPRREACGIVRIDEQSLTSDDAPLKPGRIFRALQEAFPDAFWTCDQGEHCAYALHYLQVDRPDEFRTMIGLASMGSGIGLAIGARQADRSRPVIGICGDGGFAMHAGDVLSCVTHGIDVILVVMNDGRWNMVHHGFQSIFGRRPDGLPNDVADLAGVATGFGAIGVRIETPEQLEADYLRDLARQGRPVILDVRFDAEFAISLASRSAALSDFAEGAE